MAVTEESLAQDVARQMHGHASTSSASAEEAIESEQTIDSNYEFDAAFQTKIAALVLKDPEFNLRTEGLVEPDYFENSAEASLVNLGLEYYRKYKRVPDRVVLVKLIKDAIANKRIRSDLSGDIAAFIRNVGNVDISDRDYVIDEVSTFARYQALGKAALDYIELVEKKQFDKAFDQVKRAMEVGANEDMPTYDYFAEVANRTIERKEALAGKVKPKGITTGIAELNKLLYHKGWGKGELSLLMGGPKVGKSTALAEFAKFASLAGHNVLFVTLEVSKDIVSMRLDANIADVLVEKVGQQYNEIEQKVKQLEQQSGKFIIHEFPTGSFTPAMLRRLIAKYKAHDIHFDMVVVDYADIMAPDFRTPDPIVNSKEIYIGLRAIAMEEHLAVLTATQTNREGAKSSVARMEHVSEDFNRIRIADLTISINRSEDERLRSEARLFLAASRNQKGDISIRIKQDLERMRFISAVLGIE